MAYRRLKRTTLYESPWITLYGDRVERPDGKITERYHYLHYPQPSVCLVLENQRGETLLIQAWRYVTGGLSWEIPAGSVEEGETPEQAVCRECLEETGYEATELRPLCDFYPSNGMADQRVHAFAAKAGRRRGDFDPGEIRALRWVDQATLSAMMDEQAITCGVSLLALLYSRR